MWPLSPVLTTFMASFSTVSLLVAFSQYTGVINMTKLERNACSFYNNLVIKRGHFLYLWRSFHLRKNSYRCDGSGLTKATVNNTFAGVATRECTEEGEWYTLMVGNRSKSWTNYTQCMPSTTALPLTQVNSFVAKIESSNDYEEAV